MVVIVEYCCLYLYYMFLDVFFVVMIVGCLWWGVVEELEVCVW